VPERLTSNWLPIASLPEHILLHDVSAPVEQIGSIVHSLRRPTFRYLRLIGSFATAEDLQSDAFPGVTLTCRYRIKLEEFLDGRATDLPGLPRWEARKLAINLLRQAWDFQMERRGLRNLEMASGHYAWYMPKGLLENERVEFTDDNGKRRRKALVGWSERRKVFWHFAVEARPVLGDLPHFVLRQHVIFTPDGVSPIGSKERMHLLRRRFCKSWWNDRWRDLLVAYVAWLSGPNGYALATGGNSAIHLGNKLMAVTSPVSIARDEDLQAVPVELEDELDLDDEWDSFEDLNDEDNVRT
jgi:hypothetical protein